MNCLLTVFVGLVASMHVDAIANPPSNVLKLWQENVDLVGEFQMEVEREGDSSVARRYYAARGDLLKSQIDRNVSGEIRMSVCLRNGRGFALDGYGETWQLTNVVEPYEEFVCADEARIMVTAAMVTGADTFLHETIHHDEYKWLGWESSKEQPGYVQGLLKYSPDPMINPYLMELTFDSANRFRLVRQVIRGGSTDDEAVWTFQYGSGEGIHRVVPIRRGLVGSGKWWDVTFLTDEPPPAEEFELSFYGLSDYQTSNRWMKYVVFLAIVAAVVWYVRRRKLA